MYQFARAERLLAYGIAGLAGFVDAAGFLAADRYFVSFMSGNTTRLGVELALGTRAAAVAGALIAGFTLGVTLGAIVAERTSMRRRSTVLALCGALLLLAAAGHALGSTMAFLAGCVLAMGAINNVFRRNGEVAFGVTYMTGALVRLGEAIARLLTPGAQRRRGALENLLLWASLASGGLLGALAFLSVQPLVGWFAAAWVIALAAIAWRMETRQPD